MFSRLIALVSVLLCSSGIAQANQCSVQTPVKFTLTSRRNSTGHWVAQVQLEHGTRAEHQKILPLEVDVEHSLLKCGSGVDTVQIRATITAPTVNTGPGYELFPGVGYYKFHSKSEIWNDAQKICVQEGAHLAIINSEAESKVLKDIFSRFPKLQDVTYNDFAFIGFHDLYNEGKYLTIYDEPLSNTGFTRWAGGQPDDAGSNEDCGSVHRSGNLNDLVCSKKHAFICEQELFTS